MNFSHHSKSAQIIACIPLKLRKLRSVGKTEIILTGARNLLYKTFYELYD